MHLSLTTLTSLLLLTGQALSASIGIETTKEVTCTRKTTKGDTVQMHYRGRLQGSEEEFDASYNRGTPLSFKIGTGRVIKGWDEGLLDMCVGEERTLTIPPEYGYGDRGIGPIPGGATLVFETKLVGIEGVAKDEL